MTPSLDTTIRERAGSLLDVPATSSAGEARAAFLRRLERVNYQPSEDWTTGLTLFGTNGECTTPVKRVQRQLLRDSVSAFRDQYWDYTPSARLEVWNALVERSHADPAILMFLKRISVGLQVDARDFASFTGSAAELAKTVKELLTLPPAEYAARRREWMATNFELPGLWQMAAAELGETSPALAEIARSFIGVTKRKQGRLVYQPVIDSAEVTEPSSDSSLPRSGPPSHNRAQPVNLPNSDGTWQYIGVGLGIVILLTLLRAAFLPPTERLPVHSSPLFPVDYSSRSLERPLDPREKKEQLSVMPREVVASPGDCP